LKKT
jgi:hypothetical protein